MSKLLDYLKAHRRKKVKGIHIAMLLLCISNVILYAKRLADGDESAIFLISWSALGVLWLYQTFFISDKERAMENETVDDRPMKEKLREAFAGLTAEELQAILDDDLRSEETKAVARELLEKNAECKMQNAE